MQPNVIKLGVLGVASLLFAGAATLNYKAAVPTASAPEDCPTKAAQQLEYQDSLPGLTNMRTLQTDEYRAQRLNTLTASCIAELTTPANK